MRTFSGSESILGQGKRLWNAGMHYVIVKVWVCACVSDRATNSNCDFYH